MTRKTTVHAPAVPLGAHIEQFILLLRGHKVMIDTDLASVYAVETRVLVQAVKRNLKRFPGDSMLQLTAGEAEHLTRLRSQTVISKPTERGGRRYAPYAFTEQGVSMLSSVLDSPRAMAVNIEIMRAFVKMRETLAAHKDLVRVSSDPGCFWVMTTLNGKVACRRCQ